MTLGKRGEQIAARYLQKRGYRVLARGWRGGGCELDIVALDGDEIVFVEVKTRKSTRMGFPEEAVNAKKVGHIERGAETWLHAHPEHARWRVDVVSILWDDEEPQITHFRGVGYA
ncbi:MAG: YraN family protein [Patescibacteria group bacterium]